MAKLEKQTTNELARTILGKYLNNQLVEKDKNSKEEKLLELRIKKLEADIKYIEIKNKYFETFHQPMSRRAEIEIKPQIIVEQKQVFQNHQSPYDASNKRLQCIDCGILFTWNSEKNFNDQLAEFQRHIVSKHDRVKTEIERQVLIELKYEGDST